MIVKLGDIARECKCTSDNKECPIVGLEHLEPKELLLKNSSTDPNTTFTKAFKAGQILFGRRRSYQQKASVATFDGICSGDITVIEAIPEKVEPRLLPFIIQNEAFFNYSIIGSAGGLSPRVKWQHLANYEFDLPSLDEQKVLADKLWAAYEVKESYKNLLAQTDKLLHAQFEKMFGDMAVNPFNWGMKHLKDIASYSIGLTYSPDDVSEDGIIVLRSGNIQEGRLSLEDLVKVKCDIPEKLFVKPNDILMCSRNGSAALVGKVAKIDTIKEPMTFGAFMTIIRSGYSDYLYMYFQSKAFRDAIAYGKSSTMNQITQKMLDNVVLTIPNDDTKLLEWSNFAEQSEKTKASLNKGIEAIEAVIRSLIAEGTTKV